MTALPAPVSGPACHDGGRLKLAAPPCDRHRVRTIGVAVVQRALAAARVAEPDTISLAGLRRALAEAGSC